MTGTPTCPCPDATLLLTCHSCPHLDGPLRLRTRGDSCSLPADRRRRLVAEYRVTGQAARARRMATAFGLPAGSAALDACGPFGC